MFADPQVVTVNAVAKSMARISNNGTSAIYQNTDKTFKLTISHQEAKTRSRSMVRIDQRAVVTNPLDSTMDYDTLSFYCVFDYPEYGFTLAQIQQLAAGLTTWLDSTSIGKLVGKES
jgi:hypothetical protein